MNIENLLKSTITNIGASTLQWEYMVRNSHSRHINGGSIIAQYMSVPIYKNYKLFIEYHGNDDKRVYLVLNRNLAQLIGVDNAPCKIYKYGDDQGTFYCFNATVNNFSKINQAVDFGGKVVKTHRDEEFKNKIFAAWGVK